VNSRRASRRTWRVVAVGTAALVWWSSSAGPAMAADSPTLEQGRIGGNATTATSALTPAAGQSGGGVRAQFRGRQLDLSRGWGGATICVEARPDEMQCFSSEQDLQRAHPSGPRGSTPLARAESGTPTSTMAVAAYTACGYGWACVWEHANGEGRRLQFKDPGTKNLSDYNFRDQTSSIFNNMVPGKLLNAYEFKSLSPDPWLQYRWGYLNWNLFHVACSCGGNWNDRIDRLVIKQI
jgi:hypothetical protein